MKKKMVVIDTNVLVSAAIGKGYSSKTVRLFTDDEFYNASYSEATLSEYYRVANYGRIANKFPSFKREIENLITDLQVIGIRYDVNKTFSILSDPSDNKFLDLAYACEADYLITGNHLDFTITEFYTTKIVSPKIFWDLYQENLL